MPTLAVIEQIDQLPTTKTWNRILPAPPPTSLLGLHASTIKSQQPLYLCMYKTPVDSHPSRLANQMEIASSRRRDIDPEL